MKKIICLSILIIFITSMGIVSAQDLNTTEAYVDSNIDVSGNGTITNPYKTITEAVNSDASTIYVCKGIYSTKDNSQININRNLTIIGLDEFVICGDYKNNIFNIKSNCNLTLNNIRLINTGHLNVQTYGAIINYGNLTINNGYFENSSSQLTGVLLNYGNLFVENSTFKSNNAIYYGGAITNFGKSIISNSNFTSNTAPEGEAILNSYDMDIFNSNFIKNNIKSTKYHDVGSFIGIYSSYFKLNSVIYINGSGAKIQESYIENINTTDSYIDIAYSFINTYNFIESDLRVNSNLWCSDENIPKEADDWLVMLLTDENMNPFIPVNTDCDIFVSFRIYNGKSYISLPKNINLPSYYISFEADNGNFNISGDYIKNNRIKTKYINNTKNTKIHAKLDEYYTELVIGTGYNNQEIYVSNNGSDENGNGSVNNPYKTISKAVSESLNGDTIYIFAGEYHGIENSNIKITKSLTFKNYNGNVKIYRADSCLFNIGRKAEATIIGFDFKVENYKKYFPIVNNKGSSSVINCTFDSINGGDSRTYVGGAIRYIYYSNESVILTSGNLKIDGCNFTNIENIIIRSTFNIENDNYYKHIDVKIINSIFKKCNTTNWVLPHYSYQKFPVEGIYPVFLINIGANNVLIDKCQFIDNNASAIRVNDLNSFIVSNSLFKNTNGALYHLGNYCEFNNSTCIESNCPDINFITGFTIPIFAGVNEFKDSVFYNNYGLLINTDYYYNYDVLLYNCTFLNNSNFHSQGYQNYYAKGIIQNGKHINVDYCTFVNNSVYSGGVFYNDYEHYSENYQVILNITHSIFYENSALFGNDIFIAGGKLYTSDCWWGSNQGPNNDNIYISSGTANIKNWVILSFDLENNELIAALNKVTDKDKNIFNISGTLPSRVAVFDSDMVEINPKVVNLVNNVAKSRIDFTGIDITANVTVDNQTIDLVFYNKNTRFDLIDWTFYGKGNVYSLALKSVNGYELTYQDVIFQIWNDTELLINESLKTNSKGQANYQINLSMGNYTVKAIYNGDDYFGPVNATASLEILPYYTVINIKENQTFYGNKNLLYAYLYDNFGHSVSNQSILFTIRDSDGKTYRSYSVTNIKGQSAIYLNLTEGSYSVNASYEGDGWHYASDNQGLFTIKPVGTNLVIEQSRFNGRGNLLTVVLRDDNYRAIYDETIQLAFTKDSITQVFNITTNEDGRGGVTVNLAPGIYTLEAAYSGDYLNHESKAVGNLVIKKADTILSGESRFIFDNASHTYSVKLIDIYGRELSDENVLIEIINQITHVRQSFNIITDSNGVASLIATLDIGNYIARAHFSESIWYGASDYASTIIVKDYIDGFDPHATVLSAEDLTKYYMNESQYIVQLSDIYGNYLSNQKITFSIDGNSYYAVTDNKGLAKLDISQKPGTYSISAVFNSSSIYSPSYVNSTITVLSRLISYDLTKIYKNDSQFIVKVVDATGKAEANKTVYLTLNSNTYERLTNESGEARLNINLNPGTYGIKVECDNYTVTNKITVISQLNTANLEMYYKDGSRFKARLYDISGRALSNATITFIINGVAYERITNNNGEASLAINLGVGAYSIITKYADFTNANEIIVYNMAVNIEVVENIQNSFILRLSDAYGNPITNNKVTFKVNGESYTREINQTGYAKLNINLNNGLYRIVTAFCIENYQDRLLYSTMKVTSI